MATLEAKREAARNRPQEVVEEEAAAILGAFGHEWESAPDHLKVWAVKAVSSTASDLKLFVEHLRSLGSEEEREVEVVVNASDKAMASLVRALEICAS